MSRLITQLSRASRAAHRRQKQAFAASRFGSHGSNFWFDPDGIYTYGSIHVGDDVSLGLRPVMMAALSEIRIGSHVMFGPGVVVIGGGHNTTVVGEYMKNVHVKTDNEDLGVTIEDDVWVGAGALLLRGIVVGRGSIVAAGTVLTKSVPPYAIVAGNPGQVLRFRWDVDSIRTHESQLYPPERRLAVDDLRRWQAEGVMLPPIRGNGAGAQH